MVQIADSFSYSALPEWYQDLRVTLKGILHGSLEEHLTSWKSQGGVSDRSVREAVPKFGTSATITSRIGDDFERLKYEVAYEIITDEGFVPISLGVWWQYPSQGKSI